MNKIYLDKLVDYCQITYHNNPTIYNQNAKKKFDSRISTKK